jgi:putative membrane-bound dehydrogenase-like protein
LPDDLEIELIAAEPDIVDPVAISFDERGRMFVVECRDYPEAPSGERTKTSTVRMLEDTDGDGRFDRNVRFADGLMLAQGVLACRDGILVTATPDVIHLRDTDGDDKADRREVLLTGFILDSSHFQVATPRFGIDNWIYLNNGLSGGEVVRPGAPKQVTTLDYRDCRVHVRTLAFELVSGMAQFGNTFDNWGHRFYSLNRDPIMHAVLPNHAIERNRWALFDDPYEDVAPSGGDAKIYPLVTESSSKYTHIGSISAAAGIHSIREGVLSAVYAGQILVCDPAAGVVAAYVVAPHGASFRAHRARPKHDFLVSSDPWFRPVYVADGPDGSIYVVDMYRKIIDHPDYLSPELANNREELRQGDDRGRIYRIRRKGDRPARFVPPADADACVALLSSPIGWKRDLGQRLIVEKNFLETELQLINLAKHDADPRTRLQAVWTLEGLGQLTPALVRSFLADPNEHLQENGVVLAERYLRSDAAMLLAFQAMESPSPRVRMQMIVALGALETPAATDLLVKLAVTGINDPWTGPALLTGSSRRSAAIVDRLLKSPDLAKLDRAALEPILRQLSAVTGARGDSAELKFLLDRITAAGANETWWQQAALTGLADGLARHNGALGKTSLLNLIAKPPTGLEIVARKAETVLKAAGTTALRADAPIGERVAALRLLSHDQFDRAADVYRELLDPKSPPELQKACMDGLRIAPTQAADLILESWDNLSPSSRIAACDLLLQGESTAMKLLAAVQAGKVPAAMIGLRERRRLLENESVPLKTFAAKVLGSVQLADRQKVVNDYRAALAMKGDAAKGKANFQRTCGKCHRLDGEGFQVGPDISDLRAKSKEMLLYDVLDPNRAVDPRWVSYDIRLEDGRILSGILESDTAAAMVLKRAGGIREVLAHSEIEEMHSTGQSPMPVGFEQELSKEAMADLLEFLKQSRQ